MAWLNFSQATRLVIQEILAERNRSELLITLTDDSAMAAAAMAGDSVSPKKGYNTPAATGTPAAL